MKKVITIVLVAVMIATSALSVTISADAADFGPWDGENFTTGWWMTRMAETQVVTINFTAPNGFDGMKGFYFANAADVRINLYDAEGTELENIEQNFAGDGAADTAFSKAYPAGDYTLKFSSIGGTHWVLGSCDGTGFECELTAENIDTNDATKAFPCILFTGAEIEEGVPSFGPWDGARQCTGWWMVPNANGQTISIKFTAPNGFDGITAFYAVGEAVVRINLYDAAGNELESIEQSFSGNVVAETDFSKAYPAGEYTLKYTGVSGTHFVLGSCEGNGFEVELTVEGAITNDATLAYPAVLFNGAVAEVVEPETPAEPETPENTPTSDAAIVVVAAVAAIALAGAVVCKKVKA